MKPPTAPGFWRLGLSQKLALCLVAATLAGFVLFSYFHERLEQRHLEALVSLSANRVSDIVHSSAWQAMMHNDRERLYSLVRDIGREPGINLLRIMDENGFVKFSTDAKETGTMVDKKAEACFACHASSEPLHKLAGKSRTRVFREEDGRRTLAVIRPIENEPACSNAACHAHPPARRILGVIDVHLTLDAVDAQLAEHRQQMAVFTAVAAVLACIVSALFVWLFVGKPVRELARGTRELAQGRLEHRIEVRSRDELGDLAASFNDMAAEVDRSHDELQQFARTLEDRVDEKTGELERAYKGLVASEKLASLGRLAATVAHEVNNPLFGMLTYARLTLRDLERTPPAEPLEPKTRVRMRENLHVIERESKRCGDLMKNLLSFSRKQQPKLAPMQINTVVEHACRLVAHQFELAQIELHLDLDPHLPEISGDAQQIQQIVLVLLTNAADVLAQGGVLAVRTARDEVTGGVRLSVKDNGPGIPKKIQAQIFEPFFSTKEDQHRTGLGLAVARGIVEKHGGSIAVFSEPGDGAEFVVHLPLEAPPEAVENGVNLIGEQA
jgi:two-component system NtrC family sensor kinase